MGSAKSSKKGGSCGCTQSTQSGGRRRRKGRGRVRRRTRKGGRHPRKGRRSRTRKGRLDFVTHKGNKAYNARGHRQYRKRRPYTRRRRR